jgi:hypothetical protein
VRRFSNNDGFQRAADAWNTRSDHALIAELEEALTAEKAKTDKLAAWLYDACDGFPVSQEAFEAFTADDLKAVGAAIANRADEQCVSLDEFKAKIATLSNRSEP